MSTDALASVEAALERAQELPESDAKSLLRSAKADLEAIREGAADVDDDRARSLEDRVNQRLREVDERDAYDAGMGAAMEPDEEDAP